MKKIIGIISFIVLVNYKIDGQTIDAGKDTILNYPFNSYQLGGNPTFSMADTNTIYKWECSFIDNSANRYTASDLLNDTTVANPILKNSTSYTGGILKFKLYVVNNNSILEDSVSITRCIGQITLVYFGSIINLGDSVNISSRNELIGAKPPLTYFWTPQYKISNPYQASPTAKPDTTTEYTVKITDSNGCIWVDNFFVKVKNITSIFDNHDLLGVSIYPNPITEKSKIYFSNTKGVDFKTQIIDINGSIVSESKENPSSLENIKNTGIYFLKYFDSNNHSFLFKLIKI